MKHIYKIKSSWYKFWKPREKVIVFNDCDHKWSKKEREIQVKNQRGECAGDGLVLECLKCGELKLVYPRVE